MAPEQVLDKDINILTDVYNLRINYLRVHDGSNFIAVAIILGVTYHHVQGNPKPPCERNPQPVTLNAPVRKALAIEPNARFQTMDKLTTLLTAFGT